MDGERSVAHSEVWGGEENISPHRRGKYYLEREKGR